MNRLFFITLLLGVVFAGFHAVAEYNELYFYHKWLDIPMHIMGGVLIMLVLYTIKQIGIVSGRLATTRSFVKVIASTLILWELYGVARFGGFKPYYVSDTIQDILFGILGCVIGAFIYSLIQKQSS